jgi:uncharacterized lipoprotein YajG
MKITHLLTLLLAALFFAGCASTQESASNEASDSVESQDRTGSGLLMDQYKAGEIPGYRD